jgi:hypothetical protein
MKSLLITTMRRIARRPSGDAEFELLLLPTPLNINRFEHQTGGKVQALSLYNIPFCETIVYMPFNLSSNYFLSSFSFSFFDRQ